MAFRKKCGGPLYEITTNSGGACVATLDLINCTVWPRVWRHWTSSMNSVAAMCVDTRPHTMNNQARVWRHWSPYNDNSGCVCGDTEARTTTIRAACVWRHWTSSMYSMAAMCVDTRPHTMNNQARVWRHWSPYNDNSGCVCGDTGRRQ